METAGVPHFSFQILFLTHSMPLNFERFIHWIYSDEYNGPQVNPTFSLHELENEIKKNKVKFDELSKACASDSLHYLMRHIFR